MTSRGKIILGDCLEVMKGFADNQFDLVLTDPPYGIKMDKGFEGFGGFGKPIARKRYEADDWDSEIPPPEVFAEMLRVAKKVIICGGNFFAHLLPQSKHWIFWDKLNTMPTFGDGELIWTNIDRNSVKKFTHEWNGLLGKEDYRWHPTQKPLALMRYLIQTYTNENDHILDPFAGSGTTLRAAKDLNRDCTVIEINPKYVEIIKKRERQEVLLRPVEGR